MPNLDRLAARSVVFEHAYCQYPMCNPSRTSVIIGRRPESTGVLTNHQKWHDIVPDVVPLPRHFSAGGYDTVAVGKILHGRKNQQDAGWNRTLGFAATTARDIVLPLDGFQPTRRRNSLTGPYPLAKAKGITLSPKLIPFVWGPSGLDGRDEPDRHFADQAIQVLLEKRDRPLFLAVGFYKPHLEWSVPDRYFAMYPPESIKAPRNPASDLNDLPLAAKIGWIDDTAFMSPQMVQEAIGAYYACCTFVDSCVGQLIDTLERTGQIDNTIVVLWSDHGFLLRNHFMWGKSRLFEEACRCPLMISVPSMSHPGKRCQRLVELVDLYPTLVDLCDLEMPAGLEGTSMVPLLNDPAQPWKKACFTVVQRDRILGTSVRTERYRFNQYGDSNQEELYDHRIDPGEFTNQVNNPAYQETVIALRQILSDGWRHAGPR